MIPRFISLIEKMPMTETMKLKKAIRKHEFYHRNPGLDALKTDIIYEMRDGNAHSFTTADYIKEMSRFTDPTNKDTLKANTKRIDLFVEY